MKNLKIQLLSDLHIEFQNYQYPECDSDVVVLAGDIHVKNHGLRWAIEEIKDKPVLYVLGNHEFYGKTYPKLIDQLKTEAAGTNVHVLEKDVFTIGEVNFLGCTLWTDFELFGDPKIAGYHCQQIMTDYKKIRRLPSYSKLRSLDTAGYHRQSKDWLGNTLASLKGQQNVVISHHAPSTKSVLPEQAGDMITAAYASKLDEFIHEYQPSLWLHGHMHNSSDYSVGPCRVVCNPKGYPGKENENYEPTKILQLTL